MTKINERTATVFLNRLEGYLIETHRRHLAAEAANDEEAKAHALKDWHALQRVCDIIQSDMLGFERRAV